MAKELRALGFEVIERTNINRDEMKEAVYQFGDRLRETKAVGLFFAKTCKLVLGDSLRQFICSACVHFQGLNSNSDIVSAVFSGYCFADCILGLRKSYAHNIGEVSLNFFAESGVTCDRFDSALDRAVTKLGFLALRNI